MRIPFIFSLALLALAAYAYPTLNGPSGLVTVPTADMRKHLGGQFAAGYVATDNDAGLGSGIPLRLLVSIILFEGGAAVWPADAGGRTATAWNFNGRVSSWDPETQFGLSPGYLIGSTSLPDGNNAIVTHLYLTGTKRLLRLAGQPVKLTLGGSWTKFDFGPTDAEAPRAFAGVEMPLGRSLTLCAELQSKSPRLGDERKIVSAALRAHINGILYVEAGTTNALGAGGLAGGFIGGREQRLFFGIALVGGADLSF